MKLKAQNDKNIWTLLKVLLPIFSTVKIADKTSTK